MTTLEKVAHAINDASGNYLSEKQALAAARAGLETLRDNIDRKIVRAMGKSLSPGFRPTQDFVSNKEKHTIRFQAGLNAVLEQCSNSSVASPSTTDPGTTSSL